MTLIPPAAPQWVFYALRASGAHLGDLGAATARKLTFVLDGSCTAAFSLPGGHPNALIVEELATDVVCGRNGVSLFRGRVQASTDTLAADSDTVAFTCVDYRGMLDRRLFWTSSTLSFRAEDQADIAWQLIADTQAEPGGAWGVTRGNAPQTGVLRDRDYAAGQPVGQALTQLGEVIDGFEWEIDPALNFNLYYPQRGRQTGLVLTYGQAITALTQQLDPTAYANAVYYNGDNSQTTPVETAVSTFPVDIGRWDAQASNTSLVLQDSVTEAAGYELDVASQITPAFTVTLAAGAWDPADIWVGDTVRLIVQSGRLNVDVTRRIVQIEVTLDDDGGETVALSVGASAPALSSRLSSYNSRIATLERAGGLGYIPDVPVGGMFDWPGTTPPASTMWADGSGLTAASYPELFAVIGYTYGGSGAMFALPDCRGRATIAAGSGSGLTSRTAGATGGQERVLLTATQTASHAHGMAIQTQPTSADHTHAVSGTSANSSTSHIHGFSTSGVSVDHTHGINSVQVNVASGSYAGVYGLLGGVVGGTGGMSADHTHSGNTLAPSSDHTHSMSFGSGGQSHDHGHNVIGNTDNGIGIGVADHENMPPWIAIGKVIKVLSPQAAGSS